VAAPSILVEATNIYFSDFEAEPTGQLGEAGFTEIVQLIARPNGQQVIVGGAEDPESGSTAFHLDQAKAERIEAASISLFVPKIGDDPLRAPDVLVRDMTILGSGSGEGASAVQLLAEGTVRVEGNLSFVDAGAADSLSIIGEERLEVITPTGSIRMTDAAGNPAGNLLLASENIVVTDASLAQRLAADPDFSGRNEALLATSGAVNAAGYIEAGGILLLPVSGVTENPQGGRIFVQNTGTATDFAGLTVGAGGLSIFRSKKEPLRSLPSCSGVSAMRMAASQQGMNSSSA
jgi:hypothetical protein